MSDNEIPTIQVNSDPAPRPTLDIKETSEVSEAIAAPITETVAAPEPKKQDDPKFAKKFSALSKKEKELYEKETSLKEIKSKADAYEAAIKEAKSNPEAFLKAVGFNGIEDLLDLIINAPDPAAPPSEMDLIKKRQDESDRKIKEYEDAVAAQKQAAQAQKQAAEREQCVQGVHEFLKQPENLENYDMIHAYSAMDDVWNLIEKVYIESNSTQIMTIQEAADVIEAHLLEDSKQVLAKAANSKKLAGQVPSIQVNNSNQEASKLNQEDSKQYVTLTNSTGAGSTTPPPKGLSREESLEFIKKQFSIWKD